MSFFLSSRDLVAGLLTSNKGLRCRYIVREYFDGNSMYVRHVGMVISEMGVIIGVTFTLIRTVVL